jgi:hypothetical protein
MTRTNKINDLITSLSGPPAEDEAPLPPSLPWEWDRVGHDTSANLARDFGSQTLTRYVELRAKGMIGPGASYCELLKHAHKAACKEYHTCRGVGARKALVASAKAARVVARSPIFYCVRALTVWVADVAVDAVAWWRGQLTTEQLSSNAKLKAAKYRCARASAWDRRCISPACIASWRERRVPHLPCISHASPLHLHSSISTRAPPAASRAC